MYLAPVESPPSNVPASAPSNASMGHSPQPQTVTSVPAANVEPAAAAAAAGAVGGQPATSTATHDDAVLRERLKHMGKSKHCFLTVACICFGFVLQCTMRLG